MDSEQHEDTADQSTHDAEAKDHDLEAIDRSQDLRTARTEQEEVDRFKRQQAEHHNEAEASYNEALHVVRLRMMRLRKAARERERKAAEAVQEASNQANDNKSFEVEKTATTVPTAQLIRTTTKIREKDGTVRYVTKERDPSSSERRPELRRSDSEVLEDADQVCDIPSPDNTTDSSPYRRAQPPPLPSSCPWRNTTRHRGTLKIDYSRIETEFILSNEFIDDVNTMLDFINGWPMDQIEDIKSSFEEDPDNRGRRIEFVDMGRRQWAVRLLNPDRPETFQDPADTYTFEDRDLPHRVTERDTPTLPPPLSRLPIPRRQYPRTPRPKARELPRADLNINQTRHDNIRGPDATMGQTGGRTEAALGDGQPSNTPEEVRRDSILDKSQLSMIGKLVHVEKVPGPYTIPTDALKHKLVFDRRSLIPKLAREDARNRPREVFYAKRLPLKGPKTEDEPATKKKKKKPASNDLRLSEPQQTTFRPGLIDPDAY